MHPPRSLRRCSALVLALVLALPRPAHAAWPHDPYAGFLAMSNVSGDVSGQLAASDGAGGAFLGWDDYRFGAPVVYIQHVTAAGVPTWTANGVPATNTYYQYNPVMVADGSGGVWLAWQDFRSTVDYDVYAQHLSATGAALGPVGGALVCNATGSQSDLVIVADGSGGAIVAWDDSRGGSADIYAQRLNSAGVAQWTANGVVACNAAGMQTVPRAIPDGAGGIVLTWQDFRSASTWDVYAQRVNASGTPVWTANGNAVCTAAADQLTPSICSDMAGGSIVAWQDNRNGNPDIYAMRIWYSGAMLWTGNGVVVTNLANAQSGPQMVSDGAGGALVEFYDQRTGYNGPSVQRLSANGSALWASGGVTLATTTSTSTVPAGSVCSDALGGAIVAWQDGRGASYSGYAQRVNASGTPVWTVGGLGFDLGSTQFNGAAICPDGSGGVIITGSDNRNASATSFDQFAWRIDTWGVMGGEPGIAGVKDVPNDNGGQVKVSWNASPLDLDPASYAVSSYLLFRSAPTALAAQALREGRVTRSLAAFDGAMRGTAPLYAQPVGTDTYYWEYVGQQAAYHLPTYAMVTATTGDSMSAGNPRTAFMVQARNAGGTQWWNSAADSGYSVDNVAPIAPAPFTGAYGGGATALHWNPNPETDLANYRLYRGNATNFVPGPANLVAAPVDTGYVDVAGAPYVYKLTAVDTHGNESPVATLVPNGTTGVDAPAPPRALALAAPSPNPARGESWIAFDLPQASHVRLRVFDAAGRLVRTMADDARAAGAYRERFDARDDTGRALPAGLYLVRLEAGGRALTRRLVTLE